LWTVVSRDEKFKAKNIIDGAVFRAADAVNAWLQKLLSALMSQPVLALVTAGIAGGWLLLSLGLGRTQERKARQIAAEAAAAK
jgi:AAA family ATP:ADP antiporter